jgi:hypothetical protein
MSLVLKLSTANIVSCISLSFLSISAISVPVTSAQSTIAQTTPSPSLSQQLIGTWKLVKQGDKSTAGTPSAQRLKFFSGKQWNITQADQKTKRVIFHHGGTYNLKDNVMTSVVNYANESTASRIGTVSYYKINVQGDTYKQIGINNPYTETWQRVK